MPRTDTESRIKSEFAGSVLLYSVSENEKDAKRNAASLPKFQRVLLKAGIHLEIENGAMRLYLEPEEYVRNQTRYAGARRQPIRKEPDVVSDSTVLRYSDIAPLLNQRTEKEMLELTGLPRATYYRRKKKLLESPFFALFSSMDEETRKEKAKELPFNRAF